MSILNTAKVATFKGPTRFSLHSVEGFGKTTLAAHFPAPLFVCAEIGFPRDLSVAPSFVAPKTWQELLALVDELATAQHSYQSLVFDTLDWVDPMIWRYVCERDTGRKTEMNPKGHVLEVIEDYGFGKGYVAASDEVRRLIGKLDTLQTKRGMHVVVLMHSHVKTFQNPAGDNFDRWVPKTHDKSARLIVEWSENVFFGYFEVATEKQDTRDKKAKGTSTGRRILGTRYNAMYDAKNRMNLPDTIELGDPKQLIPYLLGQHITPPKHAEAAAPAKTFSSGVGTSEPMTKQDDDKEPPRAAAYQTKKEDARELQSKIAEQYEKNVAAKKAATGFEIDAELASAIESMLADAEKACGAKYRSDVEKWVSSATERQHVDAIFNKVASDIAAAKKKSA